MRVVNFGDFAARECPFFRPKWDYGCAHPEQEEVDRRRACHVFSCPLATELNPESDTDDAALMTRLGVDPDGCSDGAWALTSA